MRITKSFCQLRYENRTVSSITQAKAEAQKLIQQYNKLQAEAKTASTEDATRKVAEAEKLVAQISLLQATINKLQAKSTKDSELVEADTNDGEARRLEVEKVALESRIARIETAQKKTREQITQLSRAKQELERLKAEADHDKRASDEKLQQELAKLIERKELEQRRLKQEMESLLQQSQQEAELLKVQRDSARALIEQQEKANRERLLSAYKQQRSSRKSVLIGISIGALVASILLGVVLFTPWLDGIIGTKKFTKSVAPIQEAAAPPPPPPSVETKPAETTLQPSLMRPLNTFRDKLRRGGLTPVMVKLPAGDFMMGVRSSQPYQDERPQIQVHLESFSISKTEVTFDDYDTFASDTGHALPDDKGYGRGAHPVINVSWDDANDYTKWLTEQTGHQYRLPSEREWEYAAVAGNFDSAHYWGNNIGQNNANCAACSSKWDGQSTSPVGSFAPNSFGLHDMIGNVLEWTVSCFRPNYQGAPTYGQNWEGGDCSRRMVRSSSYRTYENALRVTKRNSYNPKTRMDVLGFRIVRVD
jgi:formylglycine-generating enzyme required for sulfatase activity